MVLVCVMLFPYTTLFRSVVGGNWCLGFGLRQLLKLLGPFKFAFGFLGFAELSISLPQQVVSHKVVGASLSKARSEEHTSELQSLRHLVCRLLLDKKKAVD